MFGGASVEKGRGDIKSEDVDTLFNLAMEHNRKPGVFDYSQPQNFYSLYPEIDHKAYVTVGGVTPKGKMRKPHYFEGWEAGARRDY